MAMDKKLKVCLFAVMALVLLSSCSQEDNLGNRTDDAADIKVSVSDFYYVGGNGSSDPAKAPMRVKLNYDADANSLKFGWTMGDRVAVFGAKSEQQIGLLMKSIDEETALTAYYDSESYRLDEGKNYIAYYPAINSLYQEQVIPVDYTGQVQSGNNTTKHLGEKDYIVTPWTETAGINKISFAFQHIGAVLWLNIKMPDNATAYKSVTLKADQPVFATSAKLNLETVKMLTDGNGQYVDPACITEKTMSDVLTLSLTGDVKADADNMLKVWMMVSPADLTERTVTVTVKTADGNNIVYNSVSLGKSILPGRAYRLDFDGGEIGDNGMAGPVFETNDGRKWRFTSGNLYYNTKTGTWFISDKQTDYVNAGGLGTATSLGSTPELIGLFSWGATGLEDAQKPFTLREKGYETTYGGGYFPSTAGSSKNSTIKDLWDHNHVYDWGLAYMKSGRAADDDREYRVPSKDIITQLMNCGFVQGATIKGAGANGEDVTGLIVIPGITSLEEAKTFINSVDGASCLSSMVKVIHNNTGNTLSYKNITITDYKVLKKLNDAVFLPAASKRNLSSGNVYNSNGNGWYWTANGGTTNSYCLYFNGNGGGFTYNGSASNSSMVRSNQMAVRLLVEVK